MSIACVQFASRELAESLSGNSRTAVISITDPGSPEAKLNPRFRAVLRLSFFDAIPADEYMPPLPGLFNREMAQRIDNFVSGVQARPFEISMMVHCEYGVSRSAAVALFVEAVSGAPLEAREFTYEANPWVLDQLLTLRPALSIEIPSRSAACERRVQRRA